MLQKGALRARSAERKTEKEKLKEKEREREKRRKESRASARALVCYGRRARARSEIRSGKARSGRALQRERQRKRNLKKVKRVMDAMSKWDHLEPSSHQVAAPKRSFSQASLPVAAAAQSASSSKAEASSSSKVNPYELYGVSPPSKRRAMKSQCVCSGLFFSGGECLSCCRHGSSS